jgi:hypothetical protein
MSSERRSDGSHALQNAGSLTTSILDDACVARGRGDTRVNWSFFTVSLRQWSAARH